MDANSTVIRHWEDLVFENRNKSYGAYLLRRAYSKRLLSGLGITLVLITIVLSLQHIQSGKTVGTEARPPIIGEGLILMHPPSFEKPRAPEKVIQKPKRHAKSQSVVVTREEVLDQEEVTALTEFVSTEGFESDISGTPDGTSVFSLPEPEVVIAPDVLDIAEIMPQYEGGVEALMKFIQRRIRYPQVPRELGIDGTVYVRFVVRGDGSVTDVEIMRGVHPDYDREAMRVISMLPSWKGGSNNERPASVRMVLPIKFNLQ
jgi:protein TonB